MTAGQGGRDDLERVVDYHLRTRHHPHAYARSLGYMDWETQPDPFLEYPGADRRELALVEPCALPLHDEVMSPAGGPEQAGGDLRAVSDLLGHSLGLAAWKQAGLSRWALRVNPSSGNLHPTEGYLLLPGLEDLGEDPALYHYLPRLHALERRRVLPAELWEELVEGLPENTWLLGLTAIPWRESWKYGERALRYCQLDAGHALACVALAARLVGRRARLLETLSDAGLAGLLGVGESRGEEAEDPDCLLALTPVDRPLGAEAERRWGPDEGLLARLAGLPLAGRPSALSPAHQPWPVIREAVEASTRTGTTPEGLWEGGLPASPARAPGEDPASPRPVAARRLVLQRRSAQRMDGRSTLSLAGFHRMLERLLPVPGRPPFDALPWRPAVHAALFVHRVEDLDPGLYLLVREPGDEAALRAAMAADMAWEVPAGTPAGLPLFRLRTGDQRRLAAGLSCGQDIASDGAFAVAMLARFRPELERLGPWFWRRLHWEAGALGQVLYLEAEAAGLAGTGIGCFFDAPTQELLGLAGEDWADLYHFTVGGAVVDARIATDPAYPAR